MSCRQRRFQVRAVKVQTLRCTALSLPLAAHTEVANTTPQISRLQTVTTTETPQQFSHQAFTTSCKSYLKMYLFAELLPP